jgi:hypothetical protein
MSLNKPDAIYNYLNNLEIHRTLMNYGPFRYDGSEDWETALWLHFSSVDTFFSRLYSGEKQCRQSESCWLPCSNVTHLQIDRHSCIDFWFSPRNRRDMSPYSPEYSALFVVPRKLADRMKHVFNRADRPQLKKRMRQGRTWSSFNYSGRKCT